MKRNHVIGLSFVALGTFFTVFFSHRPKPLDRLHAIERQMDLLLYTSTNQSLSGKLNFLLGSLRGYPTDWQSLDKLLGTEIKKQVAAGNLVTLSFPITNLPAEYFRSFHKTALTRFKDRSWYMGVNTSRTEYLITTPPVQTNDWLRLLAEVRSAH